MSPDTKPPKRKDKPHKNNKDEPTRTRIYKYNRTKMSSITLLRIAARTCKPSNGMRTPILPRAKASGVMFSVVNGNKNFGTTPRFLAAAAEEGHGAHHEETFEEFTARYEKEFEQVQDVFELQVCFLSPA